MCTSYKAMQCVGGSYRLVGWTLLPTLEVGGLQDFTQVAAFRTPQANLSGSNLKQLSHARLRRRLRRGSLGRVLQRALGGSGEATSQPSYSSVHVGAVPPAVPQDSGHCAGIVPLVHVGDLAKARSWLTWLGQARSQRFDLNPCRAPIRMHPSVQDPLTCLEDEPLPLTEVNLHLNDQLLY